MSSNFNDEQIEVLNEWARTTPAFRGKFLYTNLQGIERNNPNAGTVGLGDLLDTKVDTIRETDGSPELQPSIVSFNSENFYITQNSNLEEAIVNLRGSTGGVSSHGSLIGLDQDDHPQYLLTDGSRNVTGKLTVEAPLVSEAFYLKSGGSFFTDENDVPTLQGDNSALTLRTGLTTSPSTQAEAIEIESPIHLHAPSVYDGAYPHGGFGFLINADGTVNASGTVPLAFGGFQFAARIVEDTRQTFSVSTTFSDNHVIEEIGTGTAHSGFLVSGFLSNPEIQVGIDGAARNWGGVSFLAGMTVAPKIVRKSGNTGSVTVDTVYGFQTNSDLGALRAFAPQIGAGVTVSEYVHYQAGSGGNHFRVQSGGTLTAEYGIRLENISRGGTNISLWSDGSDATMRHAGNVRIGDTSVPSVDLEVVGEGRFGNGAVGTPSISFLSDTDTGIYRSAINNLAISAGGGQSLIARLTSGVQNVLVPAGTASIPGLAFIGDTDTGLVNSGANALQIITNGSPVVTAAFLSFTSHFGFNSEGNATFNKDFRTSPTSPAQITSDQNNFNVDDISFIRLTTDASRTITGFVPGSLAAKHLWIVNAGSNDIVLANQNVSSTNVNRIITGTGADLTLNADESAHLWYDTITLRWRVLNTTGS